MKVTVNYYKIKSGKFKGEMCYSFESTVGIPLGLPYPVFSCDGEYEIIVRLGDLKFVKSEEIEV